MQEIKCPKCGEVFTVDESGYAAIVKQVRDKEFEKEISERQKLINPKRSLPLKPPQLKQKLKKIDKSLNCKYSLKPQRQSNSHKLTGFPLPRTSKLQKKN